MRVLDIVDGIVVRLFLREVEIEIELAVERAHEEEIARCVGADLLHEFVERDALSRALAHLHELAVAVERDHLQQQDREPFRVVAERLIAAYKEIENENK